MSAPMTYEAPGRKGKIVGAVAALGGLVLLALAAVAAVSFNDPVAMMPATAAGPQSLAPFGPSPAAVQNTPELPGISASAQAWDASSYGASIGVIVASESESQSR